MVQRDVTEAWGRALCVVPNALGSGASPEPRRGDASPRTPRCGLAKRSTASQGDCRCSRTDARVPGWQDLGGAEARAGPAPRPPGRPCQAAYADRSDSSDGAPSLFAQASTSQTPFCVLTSAFCILPGASPEPRRGEVSPFPPFRAQKSRLSSCSGRKVSGMALFMHEIAECRNGTFWHSQVLWCHQSGTGSGLRCPAPEGARRPLHRTLCSSSVRGIS